MHSRHDISDQDWERIEHLLPGRPGSHGGGTAGDTRTFVNAIRYIAKTGIPWRDVPCCFGNYNSLWQRYNRWCEKGIWQRIARALQDQDEEWLIVDSTSVRANPSAAGAKKKSRRFRRTGRAGVGT